MKQLLICIGLKVLEIGGFLFIPFYLGKLIYKVAHWPDLEYSGRVEYWMCGLCILLLIPLMIVAMVGIVLLIGYALHSYFMFNWNLAGTF